MNVQRPARHALKKPSNPSRDLLVGDEDRWLSIGAVGKPHGLRGAFFVSGRSEPIPESCETVVLGDDPTSGRVCVVVPSSLLPDRPVMALQEYSDRTAIEAIRGTKVWIPRSSLPIDEGAEFLWSDVTGAEVYDAAGILMGRIVDMANYGASDIAVIEDDKGNRLEMPFVGVYVDMSFRGKAKRVNLLVDAAVFLELWTGP